MKEYKILIIGQLYDNHQIRFISNLKEENPNITVDFFSYCKDKPIPKELEGLIRNSYCLYTKTGRRYGKLWPLYDLIDIIKLKRYFSQIDEFYDIVNIHFPSYRYSFIVNNLKCICNKIVVTPWGSDIYRLNKYLLHLLKPLYKKADYITAVSEKFKVDIYRILQLPSIKIKVLDIASDTIDYIIEHRDIISVDNAKKSFNVQGKYVICCGYNGHISQQHDKIINAVHDMITEFPNEVVLFLPFMYGGTSIYKENIVQLVTSYGIKYVLFEQYLDKHHMFLLEQACDMLIHIQSTDASSCSVQEFLLLNKKIINGKWLKYPQLSHNGVPPFIETPNVESLKSVIKKSINSDINIPKETHDYIESCGWRCWRRKWNDFFENIT